MYVANVPRRIFLPFFVAALCAGPFPFVPLQESDAPWHLALGRLILQHGIPHTNLLSWKFAATPWYPVSWLYEALCAVLPEPGGIQLVTCALILCALLTLTLACAREGPAWIVPAIALLLVPRCVPRPHVATWLALGLALWLGPGSTRSRLACAALLAVLANFHPGAVFAGFVLAAHAVEAFLFERRKVELLVALAALASIFANPGAPAYLIDNLHVAQAIRIREMEPASWPADAAFFVLALLSLVAGAARIRQRPALFVSAVVMTILGLRANRETQDAYFVYAPILAGALVRLPGRAPALGAVACALLAIASHHHEQAWPQLRFSTHWNPASLPVRAADYARANHLDGPQFNGIREGGYLAWAGIPPLFDGRIQAVPPTAWHEVLEAEKAPASFDAYLRRIGAEWAISTRLKEHTSGFGLLHANPGWALVYWDDLDELYVRRDLPKHAALIARDEFRLFHPWGEIVGSVEKLGRSELPALLDEVSRYGRTTAADPFALLVGCAVLVRLREDPRAACALALDRGAPRQLVEKALRLQAAP